MLAQPIHTARYDAARRELNRRQSLRGSLNTFEIIFLSTPPEADVTQFDRRVTTCLAV